jgi:hypothetical protein
MKCISCNAGLNEGWNFCPSCGTGSSPKISAKFFQAGIEDDLDEDFDNVFKDIDKLFRSIGFPGKLNVTVRHHHHHPRSSTKQMQKAPARPVKHKGEPEARMQRTSQGLSVELKLPGVKSIRDIFIKRLPESVEVRAYAGDQMYFKVIPIIPGSSISEKKFVNQTLMMLIASS